MPPRTIPHSPQEPTPLIVTLEREPVPELQRGVSYWLTDESSRYGFRRLDDLLRFVHRERLVLVEPVS